MPTSTRKPDGSSPQVQQKSSLVICSAPGNLSRSEFNFPDPVSSTPLPWSLPSCMRRTSKVNYGIFRHRWAVRQLRSSLGQTGADYNLEICYFLVFCPVLLWYNFDKGQRELQFTFTARRHLRLWLPVWHPTGRCFSLGREHYDQKVRWQTRHQ